MKPALNKAAAFSLVEVTLAIGVAAFVLVAIFGMLPVGLKVQQTSVHETVANKILSEIIGDMRAAVRNPGNANGTSTNFGIHIPCTSGNPWISCNQLPSTAYFTNEGNYLLNATPSTAGVVFTASISWVSGTTTTALARIVVYWPAQQTDLTKVGGFVETLVDVNRPPPSS
jgi:type II secretory pathway pseudopilin PulG